MSIEFVGRSLEIPEYLLSSGDTNKIVVPVMRGIFPYVQSDIYVFDGLTAEYKKTEETHDGKTVYVLVGVV